MNRNHAPRKPEPVFKNCVRCGYSLRGLPANHACPECGLRFDEDCELYPVTNPKAVIAVWACIFGSGWVSLKNLPQVPHFIELSAWDKLGAIAAVLWFVFVGFGAWYLIKLYRSGQKVAITGDGLIIRLPAIKDDLIPWSKISGAMVKDAPANKPQTVRLIIKDGRKHLDIGGVVRLFPTRADSERFVNQVIERVNTDRTNGGSSAS